MRAALAFALLLAGCAPQSSTEQKLEYADVNARNALARIAELSSRVSVLEERVGDLERSSRREVSQEAEIRKRVDESLAESVDHLTEKHNLVVDRLYPKS